MFVDPLDELFEENRRLIAQSRQLIKEIKALVDPGYDKEEAA